MAITYGFFAALEGSDPVDRSYTDVIECEFETWRFPHEGVVSGQGSELAVSALGTPGMAVNVAAGVAIGNGKRWLKSTATEELEIADADPADPRIDSVVVRFRLTGDLLRDAILAVKTGTPAGSPTAPAMTRSTDVYELRLADVAVAAGETEIEAGHITDKRGTDDCGWMGKCFVNPDGSFNAGTQVITDVVDPFDDQDADTKAARNAAIASALGTVGGGWKSTVVAATTAAITLATDVENGDTLDGVTLATGDRILVKNQADGGNGIYVVKASGAPDRATDFNSATLALGASIAVLGGTLNGGSAWRVTNSTIASFGTTVLTFAKYIIDPYATSSVTGTIQCGAFGGIHPSIGVKGIGGVIKRAGTYSVRLKCASSGDDLTGKAVTLYYEGGSQALAGTTAGNYGTAVDVSFSAGAGFYIDIGTVTSFCWVQFRNGDGWM